jgi:hypothetical protein
MSVGVAGCFTSMAALYYIGYVMNFAQLFYAPTVGAVSWTISAEVSSIKIRARTQSLAIVTNAFVSWVMNFIAPYLINTDQGEYSNKLKSFSMKYRADTFSLRIANLGGKAAFVWMALSFFSLIWAWFEVPEFKDRTYSELDDLFTRKTPTRGFRKQVTGTRLDS